MSITIDKLNKFLEYTQQYGGMSSAVSQNLYGINAAGGKSYLPPNRDHQGYTFFTRPQLRLTYDNLANVRKLYAFLDNRSNSPFTYARCILDPRLIALGDDTAKGGKQPRCSLVDNSNAFIPVLTNTLKSISGWPDIAMPNFTSKAGMRQEEWSITDGPFDILNANDIDCTFYNIRSEPTILMFFLWEYYQSLVFEGMFMPYMDFIVNNEIDYNTRIYRLIMDETKTFIKKIAATGASYPVTVPTGQFFDYDESKIYSDQTKEFSVKFRSMGVDYNDHITMLEFNKCGAMFNDGIRGLTYFNNPGYLEKVPKILQGLFNFHMYPYINLETTELEWYVDTRMPRYRDYINAKNELYKMGKGSYNEAEDRANKLAQEQAAADAKLKAEQDAYKKKKEQEALMKYMEEESKARAAEKAAEEARKKEVEAKAKRLAMYERATSNIVRGYQGNLRSLENTYKAKINALNQKKASAIASGGYGAAARSIEGEIAALNAEWNKKKEAARDSANANLASTATAYNYEFDPVRV